MTVARIGNPQKQHGPHPASFSLSIILSTDYNWRKQALAPTTPGPADAGVIWCYGDFRQSAQELSKVSSADRQYLDDARMTSKP